MSQLITLDHVSLAFGLDVLLDKAKLQIASRERVCLIGRNGAGKSSLLKIIEGIQQPDSGHVWRKPELRMARLAQDLPHDCTETVFEYVAQGLADIGKLLASYHELTQQFNHTHSQQDFKKLEQIQQAIDTKQGWQCEQEIKIILDRFDLHPDKKMTELSGGWQRRAALARAFVIKPELLLLDEPTNHLDIEAIQWLEDELLGSVMSLIFITHDRALLQRLATRIIELDRGQLTSWVGDYQQFLQKKEERLHAEAKLNHDFDKKLAQEEKWIRQGIKARRTRNEGRVRALEAMRQLRSKRREKQGQVNLTLNEAQASGQVVIEAKHIGYHYHHGDIVRDFSLRMMRGDRIGLIGPNGAGKSTLLNLLLGKLAPQQGSVVQGTQLQIGYFDQLRAALDGNKTVAENVSPGSDTVVINGKSKHIMSYLNDFLFTPARALTPVKALSGGECNRLLLARLFSQPTNLLVMDEPTNDLDIETLELLEELLSQYQGSLLLVSHDRHFLDNVVTSTLVFEGHGRITEYVGGYQDWLRQRQIPQKPQAVATKEISKEKIKSQKKWGYKEQRELEQWPARIEKLEAQQQELQQRVADKAFYQQTPEKIAETMNTLTAITQELEQAYASWLALEALAQELGKK